MSIRTAKKLLCILVALAMFVPAPAAALPLFDIEGAVGGWRASPSGDMKYKGNSLDLEDDLNFDNENELTGRLKIGMPLVIPNLYFMATPLEFEETSIRDKSFTFGGQDFYEKEEFRSRLTLNHYDVGLFYNVPLVRGLTLNMLNIEAGVNARIIGAKAVVEQETGTESLYEKKSETFPVPMIYLGLGLNPVERFGLEAEIRGISYSDYDIISMIGRMKVKAVGPLFISGGYRYDTYDVKENDLIIDVNFSGPFLETGVDF
ncbi:MAG: TIGR04219 family outer membrane beta-barrel protein [Desulfobacteraceae bacterium]|nr:TIGR04219 family outer membrane beta-barrel protein [Desulfobacteraceae bacterium]MCF8094966.1 TIGR04219 family outer membrane beta-barrel protein [Desulfobacteraceae bacterium]